ncbi:hypothetical protein BGZ76_007975 [Entomortierella beljakovae]|nr:hypothetical protein BGZ76_007975 [Entomortierella beljakovae]
MSDTGNTNPSGARRTPKVGVYVPRHRRGNDNPPESENTRQNQSTFNSRSHQDNNRRPQRNNSGFREDSTDDSSSSRSGNNNNTSGDVHRRGRGKFMGPGGSGSANSNNNNGGEGSGYYRDSRNNNHGSSYSNSGNSSSASSSISNQQSASQPPRQPRGRDFDATVLRKYSDDENKPGSSFSRSNTYGSGRSNNNNSTTNSSGAHSPTSRSTGRNNDASTSKNSSRKSSPKRGGGVDHDHESTANTKGDEYTESSISALVEKMQLNENSDHKSEAENSDELEEWELAFQDSNEATIPKVEAPKAAKSSKSHPAEHLLDSPASKTSKAGNWSEAAIDDDTYILELYDFSSSIKTMHLTDIFSSYENRSGGFRIKWVDDTKALVIFESAAVAKLAFNANVDNQIVKMRPYTGADKDSIRKTGGPSSGTFNGARPAKTDSVARRLVQGALGLRVKRTPEQIAEEKALVQAAKEARDIQRQEQQKQRQEQDAMFNS